MNDFGKFLCDCFKISRRLSRPRYCRIVFKICFPILIALILEWLIVTALELGARFPHTVTFIRVIMYSVTAFTCIAISCLTARRLHDIGKSGWLGWLPFLAPLFTGGTLVSILLVWWLARKDGDTGTNKYGEPPDDDD